MASVSPPILASRHEPIVPLDAVRIFMVKGLSKAPEAPVSLAAWHLAEGAFAAIAAWVILEQILGFYQIIGCFLILVGVIIAQLTPLIFRSRT